MPVQDKIEQIKKLMKNKTDPINILIILLKELIPAKITYNSSKQVNKLSQTYLVQKMVEALEATEDNKRESKAFTILNYRYEGRIKKEFSLHQLESDNAGTNHEAGDIAENKEFPKNEIYPLQAFSALNHILIAFLSVFEEYRRFIKENVKHYLFLESKFITRKYIDVWENVLSDYVNDLLIHIQDAENVERRIFFLKKLSCFSAYLPANVQTQLEKFLLSELTISGDSSYVALEVLLSLKNNLSQSSLVDCILKLCEKVLSNLATASATVLLVDAIFVLKAKLKDKEKIKGINKSITTLMNFLLGQMRGMHSGIVQESISQLISNLSGNEADTLAKEVIAFLLEKIKPANDAASFSAIQNLSYLMDYINPDDALSIVRYLNDIRLNPSHEYYYQAFEALAKFKKYFPSFLTAQDLIDDLLQKISKPDVKDGQLKRTLQSITYLLDKLDNDSLQQVFHAIFTRLSLEKSTEMKRECLQVLINMKPYLHGLTLTTEEIESYVFISKELAKNFSLIQSVCQVFSSLQVVFSANLQKDLLNFLVEILIANNLNSNNVLQSLLYLHQPASEEIFDKYADKWMRNLKDNNKDLQVMKDLNFFYPFFSNKKRREIAIALLANNDNLESTQALEKEKLLKQGSLYDDKVVDECALANLSALCTYSTAIEASKQVYLMNYLRIYISQKNTAELIAKEFFINIYLAYRQDQVIVSLVKASHATFFSHGERLLTTSFPRDIVENIISNRP